MDVATRTTDGARRAAAETLTAAVGDGILDLAEADERLARVWAARTEQELQAELADLPTPWLDARRRREQAAQAARLARQTLPAHVRSWLGLAVLLIGIWALTTPGGYFWPVWPILGTSICLVGHVKAARLAPRT